MWLFDGSVDVLPGGYDKGELSPNSPVKELKSFPQDLVLVGRSSILIKGLSSRLDIPWSLSENWAPIARSVLNRDSSTDAEGRVRFKYVLKTVKRWGGSKIGAGVNKLPSPVKSRLAALVVQIQERKERRRLRKRAN